MKQFMLVLFLVLSTLTAQMQMPHFNVVGTDFPQQVKNGNDLFALGTCPEQLKIGIGAPIASEIPPTKMECGRDIKVVNLGQTVEIWSTAQRPFNCPQFFHTGDYPVVIMIDYMIQNPCAPVFIQPTTIPFAEATANQFQLIYPDCFLANNVLTYYLWGFVYHTYWVSFPVPFDPALIGYWITSQSARIDMLTGLFYLSNRVDAMIGWVPPVN